MRSCTALVVLTYIAGGSPAARMSKRRTPHYWAVQPDDFPSFHLPWLDRFFQRSRYMVVDEYLDRFGKYHTYDMSSVSKSNGTRRQRTDISIRKTNPRIQMT